MERIEFVKEQLACLASDELFDLVIMIRYELNATWRFPRPKSLSRYNELCDLVVKWGEDRTYVEQVKPS